MIVRWSMFALLVSEQLTTFGSPRKCQRHLAAPNSLPPMPVRLLVLSKVQALPRHGVLRSLCPRWVPPPWALPRLWNCSTSGMHCATAIETSLRAHCRQQIRVLSTTAHQTPCTSAVFAGGIAAYDARYAKGGGYFVFVLCGEY